MEKWRRPGPTPEQRRVDIFVGLAVAAVTLLSLTLNSSAGAFLLGPPPSWPERVAWSLAITLPLIWRRRFPELVAIIISVLFIGGQVRAVPETQLTSGTLFAALYTLGAWGRNHRVARRLQLGIIAAMFIYIAVNVWMAWHRLAHESFAGASGPVPPVFAVIINNVLVNALFFGFAWFFGETAWVAARREHQLEVQAEQLRESQAEAGERAVIGERVRIARELHDVVAHHVSVMGVQAAASRRVMDKDPDKARAALAAVEQSARTAVDELRRMLNVLRQTGAAGSAGEVATAAIERVEDLLASARDAGLTTEYGVYGDPVPLPESMSQAVYRIVQEAVTNTLKHAGATILDVRIRYLNDALELDVTDNGRGGIPAAGSGLGLIGMRERVAAHEGTLAAGPRTGGGFRVRARFPLARTAVATAP